MNTQEEIAQAITDYQAGRMGTIPAVYLKSDEAKRPAPSTQ
jgi:hypothetical protein